MYNFINENKKIIWMIIYFLISASIMLMGKYFIIMTLGICVLMLPWIKVVLKDPKKLIYTQIIYNLSIKFLISDLKIPRMANYVTDIINIMIVFFAINKQIKHKENIKIKNWLLAVILLFFESIIGLMINMSELTLFIWSFRNIYRFFWFFWGCIVLLEKQDVEKIFKIFKIFLFINVIFCSYQYFILKLEQDCIGGTFGTDKGCNAYMNMFLSILLTYSFTKYNNKNTSLKELIIIFGMSLYIATISELKIVYVEFALIILGGIVISKPNKRTFFLVVFAIIILYITIQFLYIAYPYFRNFFSVDRIMEYSGQNGYSNKENLNRFTAIKTLDNLFFQESMKKFVGFGSGSAEVSQFEIFNSEFSEKYLYKLNYSWFSHAFLFIENGYIGIFLYVLVFATIFFDSRKFIKNTDVRWINDFVQIIVMLTLINFIYNASLRTESAYMWYWGLSLGYICNKNDNGLNKRNVIKNDENINVG